MRTMMLRVEHAKAAIVALVGLSYGQIEAGKSDSNRLQTALLGERA